MQRKTWEQLPNDEQKKTILKINRDSVNFWSDILSDDDGQLSIVRLQQLIFTIAYVVIYISTFFNSHMKYPEFDNYAFVLMGISTGTYLLGKGMKR